MSSKVKLNTIIGFFNLSLLQFAGSSTLADYNLAIQQYTEYMLAKHKDDIINENGFWVIDTNKMSVKTAFDSFTKIGLIVRWNSITYDNRTRDRSYIASTNNKINVSMVQKYAYLLYKKNINNLSSTYFNPVK